MTPSLTDPTIRTRFARLAAEDGHDNYPGFLYALDRQFAGVVLRDRRVLEVGSGRGLLALYMALEGAQVVSLEPELVGSRPGGLAVQRERAAHLGVSLELVGADFNSWNDQGASFDVIVLAACINHLYESREHALKDPETFDAYLGIARHLHRLLAPGGVVVATDACRYAFFAVAKHLGVPRPWTRRRSTIDWRVHQNPRTWIRIFRAAGFSRVAVDFPVPYRLRAASHLLDNEVANFWLLGSFILRAWR